MPPRRTKKPRQSSKSAVERVESTGTNSKHGFISLPPEMHLMILRHFPALPEEEILVNPTFIEQPQNGIDYRDRFTVFLALSQTCHALITLFLPLCWERFEACMISRFKRPWYRDSSVTIQTLGRGLLKTLHLLPLV
ncbi:hypothetical protein FRC12_007174, partial [Ceratobasidium sp. 428]